MYMIYSLTKNIRQADVVLSIVQCFRGSVKCIFLGKIFKHSFFFAYFLTKKNLCTLFLKKQELTRRNEGVVKCWSQIVLSQQA